MKEIAIVGGGPAGATCGERLARAGFRVTLFDEHLAWEKPCGGGLTYKAIEAYPYLLDNAAPKRMVRKAEFVAADGERAGLELNRAVVIYSRAVLNGLLLDRATAAGCRVERARVTRVETGGCPVRLRVNGDELCSDYVVLAAGARNRLLPETTPLAPHDLDQTVGYFVPMNGAGKCPGTKESGGVSPHSDTMIVKFLSRLRGYLWSFPRTDHLSVGICGAMSQCTSEKLRQQLHEFMREEKIGASGDNGDAARFFSHVLPSPRAKTLRHRPVMGRNWAMAGDAAAWVDPLTGEGIFYAMRSGELLAEALVQGEPQNYIAAVRREFSADLEIAARIAWRFFRGEFLGGAFTTRMVHFVKNSAAVRHILGDLFAGAQDYRSLKGRLRGRIGQVFGELFAAAVRGSR